MKIKKTAVNLNSPPNYGNLIGKGVCALNSHNYDYWCEMDNPSVGTTNGIEGYEDVGGAQYVWEGIGVVTTVWKKPSTPPPLATS